MKTKLIELFQKSDQQILCEFVDNLNFCEEAYIRANHDVKKAVDEGAFKSGREHFEQFGVNENRKQQFLVNQKNKKEKLERIKEHLILEMQHEKNNQFYDFLTTEMRDEFDIFDTNLVSSNDYDPDVINLIHKHQNGLVLDFGAGNRNIYFRNVVNFEIVDYQTTDVRGVGERLPFKDGVFDAVVSIAVLEHVKFPWICAKEILRVLKPGGDLIICVPFLQPLHGYPNHFFNMTQAGLQSLFGSEVNIHRHEVPISTHPIWSLQWILNSWANGLHGDIKNEFLNMRVQDLVSEPQHYLNKDFVKNLSVEKKFELASATVLHATKFL
jgi:SAM-dependent methyltransferase